MKIIIYDFDGTLTMFPMPKFEIIEKAGMVGGIGNPEFLKKVKEKAINNGGDRYLAMNEAFFDVITKAGYVLNDESICLGADKVVYNKGVSYFLKMLFDNGVKNYMLSSGYKVYLERVKVAPFFTGIYATTLKYDDNGVVTGIEFLMSDKNKVETIKEILGKNQINNDDCKNIIYLGDGLTDYDAMEYVFNHGGTTIFVYQEENSQDVLDMKEKNVVSLFTKADFSEDGELDCYVKKLCGIR